MLVREGDERNEAIDLGLACSLAAIAGALNAAAFYAVGFFSANMTGNVSTLSADLALGRGQSALFYLAVLGAFIGGAACSSALINAGRPWTRSIYAYTIMLEALMLSCVGGADLWLTRGWRIPTVVLGLAYAMGFQNAIGTRISGARVRTTHVSGLATDIGIELAAAYDSFRRRRVVAEGRHDLGKLRLQVCTVLSFLVGGVGGVALYQVVGGFLMIFTAAMLLGVAGLGIMRSRRFGVQPSA